MGLHSAPRVRGVLRLLSLVLGVLSLGATQGTMLQLLTAGPKTEMDSGKVPVSGTLSR